MSQFIKWLISSTRTLLAEFLVEILAIFILLTAGVVWIYFSSIYTAIAVVILGIAVGGPMCRFVAGKKSETRNKDQR